MIPKSFWTQQQGTPRALDEDLVSYSVGLELVGLERRAQKSPDTFFQRGRCKFSH